MIEDFEIINEVRWLVIMVNKDDSRKVKIESRIVHGRSLVFMILVHDGVLVQAIDRLI